MSRRRVVVTGLGCVSSCRKHRGTDAWDSLLAGKSGIDLITRFDASSFACKFAGEVKGFDLESYIQRQGSANHGHLHPFRHCCVGPGG